MVHLPVDSDPKYYEALVHDLTKDGKLPGPGMFSLIPNRLIVCVVPGLPQDLEERYRALAAAAPELVKRTASLTDNKEVIESIERGIKHCERTLVDLNPFNRQFRDNAKSFALTLAVLRAFHGALKQSLSDA